MGRTAGSRTVVPTTPYHHHHTAPAFAAVKECCRARKGSPQQPGVEARRGGEALLGHGPCSTDCTILAVLGVTAVTRKYHRCPPHHPLPWHAGWAHHSRHSEVPGVSL